MTEYEIIDRAQRAITRLMDHLPDNAGEKWDACWDCLDLVTQADVKEARRYAQHFLRLLHEEEAE